MRGGRHIPEAEEAHLRAWAAAHHSVEAFVEPRTTVTDTTVVMVASDGSWTRRRVAGPQAARKLGRSLRIPVYDVQLVGYPQRMRDHDARERVLRERRRRADLQDRDDPQR
ncbi:oxidoreductase [Pseudonocardia benzenivorans]